MSRFASVVLWILCFQVLGASPAAAEGSSAEALVEEGKALFVEGHFQPALQKFLAAIDASPRPETDFYIGLCLMELENWEAAQNVWRRLLDEGSLAGAEDKLKENLLACETRLYATIEVEGVPEGSKVTVEGRNGERTSAGSIVFTRLEDGRHRVSFFHPAYHDWSTTVAAERGRVTRVSPTLRGRSGLLSVLGTPDDAMVTIDGTPIGTLPIADEEVPPGSHVVTVTAEGYSPFRRQVEFRAGEPEYLEVRLEQRPGALVLTGVPRGAEVWLDGERQPEGRREFPALAAGTHQVRVTHPDFRATERSVGVAPERSTTLNVALDSALGSIALEGLPKGARVVLDGIEQPEGRSILERVPEGTHRVAVSHKRYADWSESVTVTGGERARVQVRLEASPGGLEIVGGPTGALVRIDDVVVGQLPLEAQRVSSGPHRVSIEAEGYRPFTRDVKVEPAGTTRVSPELTPLDGEIAFIGLPEGASITVAGRKVSRGDKATVPVRPGLHHVQVTHPDYRAFEGRVEVEPGRTATLEVGMITRLGALTLEDLPAGALVRIDGKPQSAEATTFERLSEGEHRIDVRHESYRDWSAEVTIQAGRRTIRRVNLEVRPGQLAILGLPERTTVLIDNVEVGQTPLAALELGPGQHRVTARKEGFRTVSEVVEVGSGRTTRVELALEALAGGLTLAGVPEGAVVTVDGKKQPKGTTLLERLRPGSHSVKVTHPDYHPATLTVEVVADRSEELDVRLVPRLGTVKLVGLPEGAQVQIDGRAQPTGLDQFERVPEGEHRFLVTHPGYRDWSAPVVVSGGETTTVNVGLWSKPCMLLVEDAPAGAYVYVDGTEIGQAPLKAFQVEPGRRLVAVMREGYEQLSTEVDARPGKTVKVSARLAAVAGAVRFAGLPEGTVVFVDGVQQPPGADAVGGLRPGEHRIRLLHRDFDDLERGVVIEPGETTLAKVEMTPAYGAIELLNAPRGADVFIDGLPQASGHFVFDRVAHGARRVEVKHPNFDDWNRLVPVAGGQLTQIDVSLAARTGWIRVEGTPSGAEVVIGGKRVGQLPLKPVAVPVGRHEVKVQLDDYRPLVESVQVVADGEAVVRATLVRLVGGLELVKVPAGATVTIDGEPMPEGQTRFTGLREGEHSVVVRHPEYRDLDLTVTVVTGEVTTAVVSPQSALGSIRLIGVPDDAMVRIDGRAQEPGASLLDKVVEGPHRIDVTSTAHDDWSTTVDVVADRETPVSVRLEARPARLSVEGKPTAAEVFLDGKLLGIVPFEARAVPTGAHVVKVVADGFQPLETRVTLVAGKTEDLAVELAPMRDEGELLFASVPAAPAAEDGAPAAPPAGQPAVEAEGPRAEAAEETEETEDLTPEERAALAPVVHDRAPVAAGWHTVPADVSGEDELLFPSIQQKEEPSSSWNPTLTWILVGAGTAALIGGGVATYLLLRPGGSPAVDGTWSWAKP